MHLSADQASVILGVDSRVLPPLYAKFNLFFTPLIDQLNDLLVVGFCSADVELDEVAFQSVGRPGGIIWLRYLAVARPGSSKVWLRRLPYRVTQAGQGGGGPLSFAEMVDSLMLDSDEPVLAQGCVCHTDGAKAYRSLASPLHDGTLAQYASLKLSHTCMKHKPVQPEFTKRIKVAVWNGECFEGQICLGGTQKAGWFLQAVEGLSERSR